MTAIQSMIHEAMLGIAKVGEIIEILTILVGIFGAAFVLLEIWSRYRAAQELQQMRKAFEDQLGNLRDVQIAKLRTELYSDLERRLDQVVGDELAVRIGRVETNYAKNLMRIDRVLDCFHDECLRRDDVGKVSSFDFERYHSFRSLLTRLISGDRGNVHSALGRINNEFVSNLGYQTTAYLSELIQELRQQGRLHTRDLDYLAGTLLQGLEQQLGPKPQETF
jgi:hypothetical protein